MKASSSEALEWPEVLALVGRYLSSPLGAAALAQVAPSDDRLSIERNLAEAGEAIAYLRAATSPTAPIRINLNGLPDITIHCQKLHIEGAALEPQEIFELIGFLDRAADVGSILNAAGERYPLLGARSRGIGDFRPLLKEVEGKVQADGTIPDTASPHLHRVRREMEKQKRAIQESLERFLRANRDAGVLQEEYITLRNDRFVVPVIAGQRRRLPGVIHGASSTGQTLFIEPLDTIDLNNELVRLQEEESREIFRILQELTSRLRVHGDAIRSALSVIAALDLIFAKARFAVEFDCVIPVFTERRLHVENARHPLLIDILRRSKKRVVPFTLTLDSGCRTLLISGPNTGGKTVTLKTVGLVALMAQSALPVPCSVAELPVFDQVLADIGDNQSIEQSLSTFSAHVSRLREMALDVTPESLVLLDELGSSTDPEEGGALGVALVDHFRAAGAFTLASTHLPALKIYGARTETVLNASMGFDEETLEPTYQLRTGLPGKSAGLAIAARLGMPEDILKRARASLSEHEVELAQLIADLHRRTEATTRIAASLEAERAELIAKEQRLEAESQRKEAAKLHELESRFEELQRRWQSRADETVAHISETSDKRKAADQAQRQTMRLSREMREEFTSIRTNQPSASAPQQLKIEEGVRVRLRGIREPARVRRLLNDGRIEVEAGFMKLQVPGDDVEEVLPEAPAGSTSSKLPKNVRFQSGPELSPSVREINVIGERADDAVEKVERFLDAAVMATSARVRIVHGHGMGILRRAIQDLLKSSPHVEKYYPASEFEGGTGATIVELKD